MTVKESCQYGELGSFKHLLILYHTDLCNHVEMLVNLKLSQNLKQSYAPYTSLPLVFMCVFFFNNLVFKKTDCFYSDFNKKLWDGLHYNVCELVSF